jgi:hypothetical protein
MSWSWILAAGLVLAACGGGGGAKGAPLVADPAGGPTDDKTSSTDTPGGSEDADGGAGAGASSGSEGDAPTGAAILQGNEEGARALLMQFVSPTADHMALTRSLRPTTSDYKSLFDAKAAAKIEAAQAKDWDSNKAVIKPKAGQSEVKIWSATGADLAAGKGAAKEFPGGYKKVAKHLAPAVMFFRFKFVEVGKDAGTAYDGLAFINGHWVIAPKPWRAMEGKGGGIDEGDDGASPAATPAPKPKGKPKKKR